MQPERHLVVMVFPVDRVFGHVSEGVVHPPHVPLEAEPKTAPAGRCADTRKSGAFLGGGQDAVIGTVDHFVHPLHEGDGFKVLAAALLVGHPFTLLARIIAVEHRGHGIHPQPVDVILLEPEFRVCDQEVQHLRPAIVVDQRVPVGMKPFLWIGMFIKRRSIELPSPCWSVGKCPGTQSMIRPRP